MNDLEQLLIDYNDLIARARSMIEQEMEHLKASGHLDETLVEAKQALVGELDLKLNELVRYRQASSGVPRELKTELDEVQQQFTQIIKLDRELEKLYLSKQHTDRENSAGSPPVDRARARRAYGSL